MRRLLLLSILSAAAAATPVCLAAPPVRPPAGNGAVVPRPGANNAPSALATYVTARLPAVYDLAAGDLRRARGDADQLFSLLVAYGTDRDGEAFRQVAAARRLLAQLDAADPSVRADLLPYLRAHDDLAKAMAFTVPSAESAKGAYPLLARLIKQRPQVVERLPNLAAAIAIVHGRPLERQINENHVAAADPVALLDYFAGNESRMYFGLRNMPAGLLAYVVDTTSTVADLTWALRNYAGNRNVGQLFFNVRYDYNAYTLNRAKDVTKQGYTLPNILRLGGVCADQAYFATEVAKAIGVPSAYTRAADADVSHAWVGFLQSDGRRRAFWNFDAGRYESYRHVRGDVVDPLTRTDVPDSYVSLLAESATAPPASLQTAAAYTDAALSLVPPTRDDNGGAAAPAEPPPPPPALPANLAGASLAPPRPRDVSSALDLIELALRQNEAYAPAWSAVGRLAASGRMTLDQKRRWAGLVQKLCGQKYPDFAVAVLDPMIRTVDDTAAQSRLWDGLYGLVQQSRPDLAAQVRIRQGEMWEHAHDLQRAGQAYEDVIRRYVNTSPYALVAVQKAEGVLKQLGHAERVLTLYKQAAAAVMRPNTTMAPEFMRQSNWYQIRAAYAKKLEEAGRVNEARAVLPDDTSAGPRP